MRTAQGSDSRKFFHPLWAKHHLHPSRFHPCTLAIFYSRFLYFFFFLPTEIFKLRRVPEPCSYSRQNARQPQPESVRTPPASALPAVIIVGGVGEISIILVPTISAVISLTIVDRLLDNWTLDCRARALGVPCTTLPPTYSRPVTDGLIPKREIFTWKRMWPI